jgi:hypothetical protein
MIEDMSTKETMKRFEEISNYYVEQLNGFSMEQLKRKPSENEWSIGQVYVHLKNTALFMQLRNVELCLAAASDSAAQEGSKTEVGEAIFNQGGFPPIQVHVPPSPQYTPQQPDSKDELYKGLKTVLQRMEELAPSIDGLSLKHTASHPRFGSLNAKEWFELVEMHYRHHVHQMNRLKNMLDNNQ